MPRASTQLVAALRATAARLADGAAYQWGHLGMCNCGNLVQTVCGLPPPRIHVVALEREGDWEQLANAYCPTSGFEIDDIIAKLVALGLTTDDIGHLEKLDDPVVLAALPGGKRWLQRNLREDVIAYMTTWASLLERELASAAAAA
ncbi:MAG TPA: hypothetical protein VFQ53_07000 [Kofleriaceae bacterium]|nr:hypothetical protein [Kofleriaceae bacterium]